MMMLNPHHFSIPSIQIPPEEENEDDWEEIHPLIDAYSCDEFRMYEFKVRRCGKGRSHDWTECPYVHPGEKARRRDPRKYHYSGTACPDFRKGGCKRGDGCEFAHGVFECWLHPARYRTQPCKDGVGCRRRVCFFAHTPEQLRVVTPCGREIVDGYDGSPMRRKKMVLSPKSTLLGFSGSPTGSDRCGSPPTTVEELLTRMRQMGISKCPTTGNPWPLNRVGSFGWCQSGKEKVFSDDMMDEPEWFSDLMN